MKIKLLRDSEIMHKAGEIVDASPAEAAFLIEVKSAIEIREEPKPEQRTIRKRGARAE